MNLDKFIQDDADQLKAQCSEHPQILFSDAAPIWWRTTENLRIMYQIASGAAFIHKTSRVHRDLKPQNGQHPIFHDPGINVP
jgi:hypothetical protein